MKKMPKIVKPRVWGKNQLTLKKGDFVELKGFQGNCGLHGKGECGPAHIIGKIEKVYKKAHPFECKYVVLAAPESPEGHFPVGKSFMLHEKGWKSIKIITEEQVLAHAI